MENNSAYTLQDRLNALATLLDDNSLQVRESVIREINRIGEPAHAWLEKLALDGNSQLADIAEAILVESAGPDAEAAFRRYIRADKLDLEQGSILLQRSVHPRLDPAKVSSTLDAIALRVQDLIAIPTTPSLIVRALNRVLFHELGFRGDAQLEPDPGTVLLGDVLAVRRGIPLSLAVVYMLVARRLGLEFQPVILPNSILLTYFRDKEPFVLDPFARGRCFSWEETQAILPIGSLLQNQGGLKEASRKILFLSCDQLIGIYHSRGDRDRAATFASYCEDFCETSQKSRAS